MVREADHGVVAQRPRRRALERLPGSVVDDAENAIERLALRASCCVQPVSDSATALR